LLLYNLFIVKRKKPLFTHLLFVTHCVSRTWIV